MMDHLRSPITDRHYVACRLWNLMILLTFDWEMESISSTPIEGKERCHFFGVRTL